MFRPINERTRFATLAAAVVVVFAAIFGPSARAGDATTQPSHLGENILPNPSFELTEPPPPMPEFKDAIPQDRYLPRTWEVWAKGVQYRLLDDPRQAHSGRRCVYFKSDGRAGAVLRYADVPIFDQKPWTVKVWARGKGQIYISAGRWDYQIQHIQTPLTDKWTQYEMQFVCPKERDVFWLDITHCGAAEMWVDDVSLTHPALAPLNIVPQKPLGKDPPARCCTCPAKNSRWTRRSATCSS